MRSCKKLPLDPTKPVSAGSTKDPLLAKAEPISQGDSTCGIQAMGGKSAEIQPEYVRRATL